MSDPPRFWIARPGGGPEGPLTAEEVRRRIRDGSLSTDAEVREADGPWAPAKTFSDLHVPDDAPAYFYEKDGKSFGPFSGDEIRAFIAEGRLTRLTPIRWEGQGWVPAADLPDRATREMARAAATEAECLQSADRKFVPAAPARAASAGPGAARGTPSGPGIHLSFAHPPPVLASVLAELEERAGGLDRRRRLVRWGLVALLAAAAYAATALDERVGFEQRVFSTVVPFCLAGVLLVLAATRPVYARDVKPIGRFLKDWAVFIFIFGLIGGVAAAVVWSEGGPGARRVLLGISGAILGIVVLVRTIRRRKLVGAWRAPLAAARELVEVLGDDADPRKPATGWIDVTGPEQPGKLLLLRKAPSGAPVELYRDEWLHLNLVLRDGNRLRIAATERRKVKRGFWRSRYGKSKWKAGATRTLATLEVRLRVNPAAYRVKPFDRGAAFGSLTVSSFGVADGAISAVAVVPGEPHFRARDVVQMLAFLYTHLERAAPGAQA